MTLKTYKVGEKLKHYREACVLSHKQVADALNIERSTYTKYENGKTEPSLNTLVKLAAIFNVSPTELLPMDAAEEIKAGALKDTSSANSPIYQLSKDERGLIARYRVLDREKKKQAMELMGNLSKKDE